MDADECGAVEQLLALLASHAAARCLPMPALLADSPSVRALAR
jgi:hypothetical protein